MKIEIRELEFSYHSTPVLKNVNLEVKGGDRVAIIGPNASGKTTLLKCINGILKPQKGSILIDGVKMEKLGREESAKRIGYVPQMGKDNSPSPVFDIVLMGRRPHGGWKPSKRDLEIVSEIIGKLGLEEISMRDVKEISGGQKQKVLIARALAQNPEVLLLDEPTSSLDLRHQLEVLNLITDQAKKGISVVMAMHDLNLAARYSNKIIMLDEGEIFATGGKEVLTPENVESVYGVKVAIAENLGRTVIIPDEPLPA
ncbi:MAG: ABC transporter ATP-binding protein [Thermoproteota archaeon]